MYVVEIGCFVVALAGIGSALAVHVMAARERAKLVEMIAARSFGEYATGRRTLANAEALANGRVPPKKREPGEYDGTPLDTEAVVQARLDADKAKRA